MSQPPGSCLNCGAPLAGAFCHRCGQEAVERRVPLRTLVADALGDLFALDSRVLRTLRPLFLRPGFLTAEWCRGRRVPYVPPLRLYIFVAAVFFLVLAVTETSLVQIEATEGGAAVPGAAAESLDLAALLLTLLPVYAFLALRRVYGGPWWGTSVRMALLVLGYMLLAVLPAVYLAFVWTRATSL